MSFKDDSIEDVEKQINFSLLSKEEIIPPENPFDKINFFSKIFFFWINPILKKAQKKNLEQEDIFNLSKADSSQSNFERFEAVFNEVKDDPTVKHKIRQTFYRIYKKDIIWISVLYFFNITSSLLSLVSSQLLLVAFNRDDRGESIVPLIPGLITQFICYLFSSVVKSNYNFYYSLLTVRMTGALSMKIFQKTLVYPIFRNQDYKIGDILNMVQVDILQIVQYIQNVIVVVFIFPFLVLAIGIAVMSLKNYSILLILVISTTIFFIISFVFGKLYGSIQKKFMIEKDIRMRSLEEMMRGVKTIKYNSLETFFDNRIKEKRESEVKQVRNLNFLVSLSNFTQNISSTVYIFLVALFIGIESYSNYTMINSSFFIILNFVSVLPFSIQNIVVGSNSMSRIDNFLTENFVFQSLKTSDLNNEQNQRDNEYSVVLQNAQFSWNTTNSIVETQQNQQNAKFTDIECSNIKSNEKQTQFKIKDISFKIKKGEFVVFYGELGSGKSSLLQGILGEMDVEGGELGYQQQVKINGSISLSSQDPWIIQDTVSNNIIYGQEFNQIRYNQSLHASCLEEDIAYFVDGDETNIGDKGDTLSGGQRKRINLARAIYKDTDIYFLDDPLSALDIKVATHIRKHCLEGMLKNKTRIIFTNSIVGMENADRIFLLNNGKIINQCNYNQIASVIGNQNNIISQSDQIQDQLQIDENQFQHIFETTDINLSKKENQINHTRKLIKNEDIQQGIISFSTFKQFISDLGGIICMVILFLILGGYVMSYLYSNLTINDLQNDDNPTKEVKDEQFKIMMIFCLCDFFKVVSIFLYECLFVFQMIIFNLLRGSFTKFYNLITTGRLMNRLSKDIYEIDILIPKDLASIILNVGTIIVAAIMSGIICSIRVIPIIFVYLGLSIFLAIYFLKAKRQLVRIEATSKSPILQYFSDVIRGIFYLRNCVGESKIKDCYQTAVDTDLRNQIVVNGVQYWFECITTFLGMFPIVLSCIILYFETSTSKNSAVMMAVMISKTSISLINLCQSWISYETHLINYERCIKLKESIIKEEYDQNLIKKSISNKNQNPELTNQKSSLNNDIEQSCPNSINFINASFQYRQDLPNCLNRINLKLSNNQKIGIVGRTGAGKTSISLALTKIIDLVEGDLLINGKSIKQYSLSELRKTISVVSQEPYIFEGTLLSNVDPHSHYSHSQITQVFEKCGFSKFSAFKTGLQTQISQLGDNLSQGEKQLISIARVILRKTSIIIVDEPTSHIDTQMEEHVTNILNQFFKDNLVITIAHKVKTIMNSDIIIVLDHGAVKEIDQPQKLLENKSSQFSQIINLINNNQIN